MTELTMQDMRTIDGGGWAACGLGLGGLAGATFLFGTVGFVSVVNKAGVLCGLSALF